VATKLTIVPGLVEAKLHKLHGDHLVSQVKYNAIINPPRPMLAN
jgi:hypothetical protein